MIKIPKKIKRGLKVFGMCVGMCTLLNVASASIKKDLPISTISDTFPTSYQSYIDKLKEIYPNATFKAVYTGLNWNTVLKHESYEVKKGISLVPSSYSDVWKKDGENIYMDGYFVVASKSAVAYVLDPRNSLYEKTVFQFEGLSYNPNISTEVIEKVIVSSPMVGTYAKKYKNGGQWQDMDMSYAEIINKVGEEQGVSSVYIASRMIQETSGDIVNNVSINGSNSKYPGVYNFFNIGATPNSDGTGAAVNGLKYAKSQGWTTPYLSIAGGVNEIKSSYIKYGQDTVYFQKFDVNNPHGNATALMAYQYQTNIMAPTSESLISYRAYKKLNMLDTSFTFYIPVYDNMPEHPAPYPAGDNASFTQDNTKVYLDDKLDNGIDTFNIRSSASSELDNIIYTLKEEQEGADNRTIMTRKKSGEGYDWDYVEFTVNGSVIKGYVWKEYVNEYNYTKVESVELDSEEITIEVGTTHTLTANIKPSDAKFKDVNWQVKDETIASVLDGVVTANAVGTTTVTVTTLDGEKIDMCTVNVMAPTFDISLDKEAYLINVDEEVEPVITLKNIEEYEVRVQDETVAIYTEGKIKGLTTGETTLEVTAKAIEQPLTKTAKIVVVEKDEQPVEPEQPTEPEQPEVPEEPEQPIVPEPIVEEYKLSEGLNLNLETKVLTGVMPSTTLASLKEKIELINLTLVAKDVNGNILTDEAYVGTDTILEFVKREELNHDKLTIVICGDVTGDGLINSADLLKTVKYLKGTSDINIQAADTTKDSEINSADLLKTVKFLKDTATIDFN